MPIDRTKYAIVLRGVFSASGYDEIQVRTILKKDAERILKDHVPDAKTRRDFYRVVKL